MADLLSNDDGRNLLYKVACFLGRDRMSKSLKRQFYRAWQEWRTSGSLSLATLLGNLNPVVQDEMLSIGNMLGDLGCFEGRTYDNMTIYVDADNGSDSTGDGSQSRPYQSLSFLTSDRFPHFINHQIRILISGNVTSDAICCNQIIGPFGSLSILGQGAPTVVTTSVGAGPFALTNVIPYTPGPISGWQFRVAETFGVDELYGKWLRFEDGPCAGQSLPIHGNAASEIYTRAGWDGLPVNGNEFVIVEPSNTITCPIFDFKLTGPIVTYNDDRASRFNLANLKIDVSIIPGVITVENKFRIHNTCKSNITFCTLIANINMDDYCLIENSLNEYLSWDTSLVGLSESGLDNLDQEFGGNVSNCGFLLSNSDWPAVNFNLTECRITQIPGQNIIGLDARGRVTGIGPAGTIHQSAIGHIRYEEGGSGTIQQCFLSGRSDGACVNVYQGSCVDINYNWFHGGPPFAAVKAQDCLEVRTGDVLLRENDGQGAAGFSGHGIAFAKGAGRVVSNDADHGNLVGTTGDVLFNAGVGTTAYPIADAQITDALGNYMSYINT